MHQRLITIVIAFVITASAAARDTRKELTVNLRFAPQEGVQANSPDLTPAILERTIDLRIEDARGGEDALDIGQGTNDDDKAFTIRASTEVVPYLTDTLRQVAEGWGIKLAAKPDRVLTLRVARFFVDESNKALGSVYAAEVKLTYVLADAAGRKLMEGAASGSAHRYGRARSADNCNEVLSDSLKEAFANVVSDPQLQEAWSSGRAASGAQGGSADSVEERLRKLDELLKKGLITKDEYDKKRAEILKDI
ncbi:MAG TPA: SHOCT domain-containing protein [Thermoanaerobaculia bacterium]|nr:SHOCT domain-containing protein [Thermoanaerobaculia bacterium]